MNYFFRTMTMIILAAMSSHVSASDLDDTLNGLSEQVLNQAVNVAVHNAFYDKNLPYPDADAALKNIADNTLRNAKGAVAVEVRRQVNRQMSNELKDKR